MKKNTTKVRVVIVAALFGLFSGYAMAKPPIATCEEHCTLFCAFLGMCK
jgi:hypothetical protein